MEIALNKESKRKTPSVIAFRDKSRLFGEEAINLAARFPASSYGYLLDLLGKDINNPIVDLYKKRFPYYNIQADPERNTVNFKNGDEVYTVEEMIAQLLQRAQEFAQDATGQAVQECVLIVQASLVNQKDWLCFLPLSDRGTFCFISSQRAIKITSEYFLAFVLSFIGG